MFAGAIGFYRVTVGVLVLVLLGYAYSLRVAAGDSSALDFFGYFTNQTSLLAGVVFIATGTCQLARRQTPRWLTTGRAIATTCLILVSIIYNVLVPGTGSAPPWVSSILHVAFPLVVALDWLLVGDRPAHRWRDLWIVLPYPVLWLIVVLTRGVLDGWVPYGFLLPERGVPSLLAHILGLLGVLTSVGALVWAASRTRGALLAQPTRAPSSAS